MHMDKSVRLETYVPFDTARVLDNEVGNKSKFIREAINEKMDREL